MKKALNYALLLAGMTSLPAMAHISFSGRDFGTFDGTIGQTNTISYNSATGNFGWIDGTDADWGDSHKVKPYDFHLTAAADVKITFQDQAFTPSATATVPNPVPVMGGISPGFSLYSGVGHVPPAQLDHDTAAGSIAIRDAVGGVGMTEGSFRAQDNWSITNDNNDPASVYTYIGSAYNGNGINYGTGIIAGADGVADHMVSKTFHLPAGDYSLFAGGTDYANQSVLPQLQYGISGTVAVVPEPETYAMLLAGLGLMGAIVRRRNIGGSI
ncbi:MAG: FxDxF family PEP-CTERM protein [Nitrosospira sp.]